MGLDADDCYALKSDRSPGFLFFYYDRGENIASEQLDIEWKKVKERKYWEWGMIRLFRLAHMSGAFPNARV